MIAYRAKWRHVAQVSYEVGEERLRPYLPAGLELDPFEQTHYVSLLAFAVDDVRVLGFPLPRSRERTKLALQFAVKRKVEGQWRRGVALIPPTRKFPGPGISVNFEDGGIDQYGRPFMNGVYGYEWAFGDRRQSLHLRTQGLPQPSQVAPLEQHLLHRLWSYARGREMRITRPEWFYWDVSETKSEIDFSLAWDSRIAAALTTPALSLVAKGSLVAVDFPQRY